MLSRIAYHSSRVTKKSLGPLMARPVIRGFADTELMKQEQDEVARSMVAKEDKPIFSE
jgi:hypothetical protein